MANDYSKYDLEFIDSKKNKLNNLSKRRLAFEIIKHLIENNIDTSENINIGKFNNKLIIPNEKEFDSFSDNLKGRFYIDSINDERVYISNQWGKPAINKLLEYVETKNPNIFNVKIYEGQETDDDDGEIDGENDESILYLNTNKNSKMNENYPLNQIFYGPPGTGKTHNTLPKAFEIISKNLLQSNPENHAIDDFDRIIRYIKGNFVTKEHNVINGKSFYRDLKAIFFLWGHILDAEFHGKETLKKEDTGVSGTYWPMNYRIITHWGFVDDWNSKSITLNDEGEKFKVQIKKWLAQNQNSYENITPDFNTDGLDSSQLLFRKGCQLLREWTTEKNGALPDFVIEKYLNLLVSLTNKND